MSRGGVALLRLAVACATVLPAVGCGQAGDAGCPTAAFDRRAWLSPDSRDHGVFGRSPRQKIADELVACRTLLGRPRAAVRAMLGRPYPADRRTL